jgi:hypothetical protein
MEAEVRCPGLIHLGSVVEADMSDLVREGDRRRRWHQFRCRERGPDRTVGGPAKAPNLSPLPTHTDERP